MPAGGTPSFGHIPLGCALPLDPLDALKPGPTDRPCVPVRGTETQRLAVRCSELFTGNE